MRRSTDNILTTHTGSLPRPAKVVELLLAEKDKPGANRAALDAAVDDAVAGVVKKQIDAGIDVINDGEQGRTDYTVHVLDRLTGFEGKSTPPLGTGEPEFPELAAILSQFATPFQHRPACSGPVGWKDWPAAEADIARAKAAMAKSGVRRIFHDLAVAGADRALSQEPLLQDRRGVSVRAGRRDGARNTAPSSRPASSCSSIARTSRCPTRSIPASASRTTARSSRSNVEALNDVGARACRPTACACTSAGARRSARTTATSPLKEIADILLKGRPQAVSFPGANPRHGHEWKVWKDVKLPDGKIIIPGVIDSTSNFVEHPELVADRIVQYARVVGKENVIAGVDCGFGTFAGRVQVDTKIVWMKLASLAEGAKLASDRL